jgi:hypothetical protein
MKSAVETQRAVSYYVYYRIAEGADGDQARARVRAMQQSVRDKLGVGGRLLERRDDPHTWMEVYETVSDPGFEHALQREAEAAGLARFIEPGSTRHVERFVECA